MEVTARDTLLGSPPHDTQTKWCNCALLIEYGAPPRRPNRCTAKSVIFEVSVTRVPSRTTALKHTSAELDVGLVDWIKDDNLYAGVVRPLQQSRHLTIE